MYSKNEQISTCTTFVEGHAEGLSLGMLSLFYLIKCQKHDIS